MSIVCANDHGWVVDHALYIQKIYQSTYVDEKLRFDDNNGCIRKTKHQNSDSRGLSLRSKLFGIYHPFMTELKFQKYKLKNTAETGDYELEPGSQKKRRKRKLPLNDGEEDLIHFHEEVKDVMESALHELVSLGSKIGYFKPLTDDQIQQNNTEARRIAGRLVCDTGEDYLSYDKCPLVDRFILYDSDLCTLTELPGLPDRYLLPPHSSFLISDYTKLQPLTETGIMFDIIVMDPPWSNKSVKRKKMYNMMWEVDLEKLPMKELTAEDALLFVWVTNKQKLVRYVKETLFPLWSVQLVAQWYWLKVTTDGTPIYSLDSRHKKPYEIIVIGRRQTQTTNHPKKSEQIFDRDDLESPETSNKERVCVDCTASCEEKHGNHQNDLSGTKGIPIPENRVIVSVPCSIHSAKPPLAELLKTYIKSDGKCLELFARNLLPGWTSWGNEVLKHQHCDYYEDIT